MQCRLCAVLRGGEPPPTAAPLIVVIILYGSVSAGEDACFGTTAARARIVPVFVGTDRMGLSDSRHAREHQIVSAISSSCASHRSSKFLSRVRQSRKLQYPVRAMPRATARRGPSSEIARSRGSDGGTAHTQEPSQRDAKQSWRS